MKVVLGHPDSILLGDVYWELPEMLLGKVIGNSKNISLVNL